MRNSDTLGSLPVTATNGSNRTVDRMPVISRFLGIVISMYHREHGVAHFHAHYAEYWVSVEVESGKVHGTFPERALHHVLEWAALHREELLADWQRARDGKTMNRIAPLE
jgi:Domain of unknown function (DUF4160)